MFWVLKRTVSLRRFFRVPTTYVLVKKKQNIFCYALLTKGLSCHYLFVLKMSSAFTSDAYIQVHFRLDFFMEANNMNPDQQSDLGPYDQQSNLGPYCCT